MKTMMDEAGRCTWIGVNNRSDAGEGKLGDDDDCDLRFNDLYNEWCGMMPLDSGERLR